jgi:pheganomycin biosynthesis PGM1-like protein
MNEQDYRLAEPQISDTTRSAGRLSSHVHPIVRALPRPTAHPAVEAWRGERFARLQQRLLTATTAAGRGASRRSVVVLPSRSVDRWHEPPAETRSYEERLLSFLLDLRDPALEMTYVSSLPVAQRTIDYYISLLPPSVRRSARKRLRLVSLGDDGHRPLSEKLLERPRVLERIRRALHDPRIAYLMPYNATHLERDVALALDIPLFGADPGHAWFGTKSGSRSLFATAGVPHPLGAEHIRTIPDAIEAICLLRAAKPELAEAVIKLDHAVSGEGNAIVDLAGLPASGTVGEGELIQRRLERLVPDVEGVSSAAYLRKLAAQGGVVEERIIGRDLRSPSVQLEITPAGAVRLLSTHDQILHGRSGQQFAGCRFPADRAYAPVISALAQEVGEHLADTGVIGRLAVDFLVIRRLADEWQPFALEVNLRLGGTTHPYQALVRLTGGSYDAETASFTTRKGEPRHYVATDHLEIPQLPALGQAGLLARGTHEDLRFDQDRGRGVVFHMLSSIDSLATVGVTAIADAPDTADHLYAHAGRVLARAAGKRAVRDRPVPVRAALGAPG